MLGPFKIIGPFLKATQGADAAATQKLALQATLFASLALLVAALLGESILDSYGIPLPILALAAGIILFLVALQNTLQQFGPEHAVDDADRPAKPSLKLAMTPLAFPAIVTPYGIATLVVFLSLSAEFQVRLTIGAAVLGIMVLNLLTMLVARRLLPVLSVVLPILGAVLGVVQVALGLQIMHRSIVVLGLV
jgi:multiple antibiotic resistance protein